jgi:hypothetical protein
MFIRALASTLICGGIFACTGFSRIQHGESEAAALKSLEEYMRAFNARDAAAWAATLNYPHVRIASGEVKVWRTAEEYIAGFDFGRFADAIGWERSAWDSIEFIQSSEDKVHAAVQFSRYNAENERIATYRSFYVLTNHNGHWGTQARSSFAP